VSPTMVNTVLAELCSLFSLLPQALLTSTDSGQQLSPFLETFLLIKQDRILLDVLLVFFIRVSVFTATAGAHPWVVTNHTIRTAERISPVHTPNI